MVSSKLSLDSSGRLIGAHWPLVPALISLQLLTYYSVRPSAVLYLSVCLCVFLSMCLSVYLPVEHMCSTSIPVKRAVV